ncbi:helix-turn-helix domain-containing protein [Geomicrobium sp. JSM 1781026]|uniref:helix-turn-helix domain-containing protein n=1 Tax=Geomicrobium sp. JSM 1781026 TaxID=3344580 RepID=UPI0035C077A0
MIRSMLGEIMKERGLSNAQLVEKTNVSRNTLRALEKNASTRIDFDTLNKLCRSLKLTPCEILVYVEDDGDNEA